MSFSGRLDRFQRKHRVVGFPLAVVYKFIDDQGGYLAALIAYYGFISLFPLLLLLATVLGLVLVDNPSLQTQILNSAVSQFPLIGDQLGKPEKLSGGTAGLVIGIVGSLYGGLGVAQASQNAMNVAWAVPRNLRPDPIRSRGRGIVLLSTVGIAILGITVLSAVSSAGLLGPDSSMLVFLAAVALDIGIFTMGFKIAAARELSVKDVLPGAVVAAIVWQLLQSFGGVYVRYVVGKASATNSVFAVVLGLLAFLYVASIVIVFCVEINVVRVDKLHPRALLTPFTDRVELTDADRLTYTGQAEAQRSKGFEDIDVTFHDPPLDDPDGRTNSGL